MFANETDILAKDIKRLLLGVYKKYKSGKLTDQKAYREVYLLNSILKAIEVVDLEERLSSIEQLISPNEKT